MEFTIPITDTEVDTDDLSGSASGVAGDVAGFGFLFGIVATASYLYKRATADIDASQTEVPGV